MKTVIIVLLLITSSALAVLCHNWSEAYASLAADFAQANDPASRRADIYVLTNGDVWVLFDGRWVYKFQGACKGLKGTSSELKTRQAP